MKEIIFNPAFKTYKAPLGANLINEEINLNLFIIKDYNLHYVKLIIENDSFEINKQLNLTKNVKDEYYQYSCSFAMPQEGHYWYYFEIEDIYGKHFIIPNDDLDAYLSNILSSRFFLGINGEFNKASSWPLGKVIYQIMVDRFYQGKKLPLKEGIIFHDNWASPPLSGKNIGKDFFGGNLSGITQKLSYLKSLSVGIIYLNPIFEASSNHKYDTGDYLKIDPMFGDEEDLKTLIKEASKLDIKIVFDGVFNHTGSDSLYFNKEGKYPSLGAYQSKNSPYYSWYQFVNYPHEYHSWWGFKTLPSVNQKDASFLSFITGKNGVLDKWLKLGLKGVRLDVIDELNDDFIEMIYAKTKEIDQENFIIGEVWEDAALKVAYNQRRHYFNGRQLDSVMNYPLKKAILSFILNGNPHLLRNTLRKQINNYPSYILHRLMNILGTHDTERLTTVLLAEHNKNEEYLLNYHKLASVLQYTLPGIPSLYYGDEIGLEGGKDPFCRGTFKWDKINSPLVEWYKQLGQIRQNEVFRAGEYQEEEVSGSIFIYLRKTNHEKIIIIINRSYHEYLYKIKEGFELLTKQQINHEFIVPKLTAALIKVTC